MTPSCPHCGRSLKPDQPVCAECGKAVSRGLTDGTASASARSASPGGGEASRGPRGGPTRELPPKATSAPPRGRDKSRDFELVGRLVADKYKVLDVLGQGGFGTVYLVEITAGMVGQRLALKILPADLSEQEAFRTQFLNEIRVAMRLVDRSIVQIRDVGVTEGGLLYYTMDFCPGTTLAQILRREGRLPVTRTLLLVLNVLRALQAAHALAIIHRDLKPANIMVEEVGGKETVRVLDFGIATAITGRGEQQKGFAGSPPYMPPEQFLGEAVGFYTDTYAIGVILYECITGQKPHPGSTAQEVYRSLKTKTLTPPEELVPEVRDYPGLSDLILRSLEKNPERRYQSARELFDAVNAVLLRGTTLERPPEEPAQRPAPYPPPKAMAPPPAAVPRAPAPPSGPSPAARAAAGRIRRQRAATLAARRTRPRLWPVALATFIIGAVVVGILFHRPIIDWWSQQKLIPGPSRGRSGSPPSDAKTPAGTKDQGSGPATKKPSSDAAPLPEGKRPEEGQPAGKSPSSVRTIDDAKKSAKDLTIARFLEEAREAARRGDWEAASSVSERAVRLDSENTEALLLLAEALASVSPPKLDEAERLASRLREASPGAPGPVEVLALVLEKAGKTEEVRGLLSEAMRAGIDSPRIRDLHDRHVVSDVAARRADAAGLLGKAREAFAAGEPAKALELVSQSLATFASTEGDLLAAFYRMELGDVEDGERSAAEALGRESPPPSKEAKDALESFKDYFATRRVLEGAGPLSAEEIAAAEGRLARAGERIAPQDGEVARRLALRILLARGRALAMAGDAAGTAKALEPLQKEKDPALLAASARIHMEAGRDARAGGTRAEAYLSARRLIVEALRAEGLPAQRRAELLLLLGICQAELGTLQRREAFSREAIQSLGEAEKLGLRTVELYETWSRAYAEVGNLIAAASCLRQVYELDPTPERCLRAVDAYMQANPETARELLRECRERFPGSAEVRGR